MHQTTYISAPEWKKNTMERSLFALQVKQTPDQQQQNKETLTMANNDVPCNPLEPWIKHVRNRSVPEPTYEPVWDINDLSKFHQSEFATNFIGRRFAIPLDASLNLMVEMCFADSLVDDLASKSRSYAMSKLPPSKRMDVSASNTLHFIAMHHCMGVARPLASP